MSYAASIEHPIPQQTSEDSDQERRPCIQQLNLLPAGAHPRCRTRRLNASGYYRDYNLDEVALEGCGQ
jgi:hypothetical protein